MSWKEQQRDGSWRSSGFQTALIQQALHLQAQHLNDRTPGTVTISRKVDRVALAKFAKQFDAVESMTMLIKVRSAKSLSDYRLAIEFSDDTIGERDFSFVIRGKTGPKAEPLKDPDYFARVSIDSGALTWPNGYDWGPIALHDEMKWAGLLRRIHADE